MIIHSQTIILKSFPYSETSLIARCFTREMGKVSVIVRGAKRKNSPMAAYFQPMSYLDLVFYYKQSRELQTVSKAAFKETWPNIQDDLKKITYSLSVIELTDKTITDHDQHANLFDELVMVLRTFDERQERLNLVFWYYELKLLTLLGFKPDFEKREFAGLVLPDPFAAPHSRVILEGLLDGSLDSLPDVTVTAKDRQVISDYLFTNLKYHFDGLSNLKSFAVLKQILS